MADDREVLKQLWDGRIPVCLTLALDENVTVYQPDPLYLLVPRFTYFPLICDKVQKHFMKFIEQNDSSNEMWLENEGQPLKWHYPIGVLFDLSGGADAHLPWNLTVHFQNFPEGEILHCNSKEAVESHFIAMIKEADALKHRGQIIHSMQKKDHKQLWLGMLNDKFDQFWAVNRKLMEHTDELFKHIPFRIYIDEQKPILQKLYRPISEDGKLHNLQELLEEVIPDIMSSKKSNNDPSVIIQGIEPPLDASIQWLSEHFSHPDNFLHICIVYNAG